MTDFRPGYRVWQPLPTPPEALAIPELAAQVLDCRPEQFVPTERTAIIQHIGDQLGERRWVLFYETSADSPVNDWFHILRDELHANVYRLTAASIDDLEAYLDSSPETGLVLARQVAPDTGEFVDLETLFSVVKTKRPQMTTVADISFGLGALPYYHTHWQADFSIISRPQLGHYLIGDFNSEALDSLPQKNARPILGQHLQLALEKHNWWVWNRVQQEAHILRVALIKKGYTFSPQTSSPAITAFSLGSSTGDTHAYAQRLQDLGFRVQASVDLDRNPIVLIQHAPNVGEIEELVGVV